MKTLATSVSYFDEGGTLHTMPAGTPWSEELGEYIQADLAWVEKNDGDLDEDEDEEEVLDFTGNSSYKDMTVPVLRNLARDRGVDITGLTHKDDIIEALEAADE